MVDYEEIQEKNIFFIFSASFFRVYNFVDKELTSCILWACLFLQGLIEQFKGNSRNS